MESTAKVAKCAKVGEKVSVFLAILAPWRFKIRPFLVDSTRSVLWTIGAPLDVAAAFYRAHEAPRVGG